MKRAKRARLEAAGWKVGTTTDFLGLSAAEAAYVEMKLALAGMLRERRAALVAESVAGRVGRLAGQADRGEARATAAAELGARGIGLAAAGTGHALGVTPGARLIERGGRLRIES